MPCITWMIGTMMTLSQHSEINQFVDQFSSKVASTQFNPFTRIFGPGSSSSVQAGVCRLNGLLTTLHGCNPYRVHTLR